MKYLLYLDTLADKYGSDLWLQRYIAKKRANEYRKLSKLEQESYWQARIHREVCEYANDMPYLF